METAENPEPAEETFAQALAALKDEYDVREPAISDAIGVHVSTVNNWANGKALPRGKYVTALAEAYPKMGDRLFAAFGKRPPAPLRSDERQEVLEVFDRLTAEQRKMLLLQASAVADSND